MKRRQFITLLGGAAVAWPLAARAQQGAIPVVGFLGAASAAVSKESLIGFRQGLRQTGYIEGQNTHIAFRWADDRWDRLPELAGELANLPVAVIVAPGTPAAKAAISVTRTVPIVFATGSDPVKLDLVASLNRPGGNATGVSFLAADLVAKHFELLREMLPTVTRMGLLVNPASAQTEAELAAVPAAIKGLGLEIVVQHASRDGDLETAFAKFLQQHIGALVVGSDAFFRAHREQLVSLATRHALPVMYYDREFVADGGLIHELHRSVPPSRRFQRAYSQRRQAG